MAAFNSLSKRWLASTVSFAIIRQSFTLENSFFTIAFRPARAFFVSQVMTYETPPATA
jgi:hypothetical protein